MQSPIPWMGGKRRLARFILPRFPAHHCYVEPFAGGAALLFLRETPAAVEVMNDIDGELINLFRVLKNHLEEFMRQFKWALTSRQVFDWNRKTPPEVLTDIQRAARFYYLQKTCFGAKCVGQSFGTSKIVAPRFNLLHMEEDLSAAHLRLARVMIEQLDWVTCIEKYDSPNSFFFMDPPYLDSTGYLEAFPVTCYDQIAQCLARLQGKAILTLNDHPEVRRLFKGLRYEEVTVRYTVGGVKRSEPCKELLFYNWV